MSSINYILAAILFPFMPTGLRSQAPSNLNLFVQLIVILLNRVWLPQPLYLWTFGCNIIINIAAATQRGLASSLMIFITRPKYGNMQYALCMYRLSYYKHCRVPFSCSIRRKVRCKVILGRKGRNVSSNNDDSNRWVVRVYHVGYRIVYSCYMCWVRKVKVGHVGTEIVRHTENRLIQHHKSPPP